MFGHQASASTTGTNLSTAALQLDDRENLADLAGLILGRFISILTVS